MSDKKSARLILEDGTTFTGDVVRGYETATAGEVVFNTAMTGYPESLTDPSYEAVRSWSPPIRLVGNYGAPPETTEPDNVSTVCLESFPESIDRVHVIGAGHFGLRGASTSHWTGRATASQQWLRDEKRRSRPLRHRHPRQLTKHHPRDGESMLGKICRRRKPRTEAAFADPNAAQPRRRRELRRRPEILRRRPDEAIVLVDCGCEVQHHPLPAPVAAPR